MQEVCRKSGSNALKDARSCGSRQEQDGHGSEVGVRKTAAAAV